MPTTPDTQDRTTEPIPESGPLTPAQSMLLCTGCVRCCTYVAVEVDPPDTPWMYDQYIWLLYHKGVWMYVERGNRWYVQFETVCERLSPQGRCTIHGHHPVLCKEYDARSCERRGDLSDVRARFYEGADLEAWMRERRPVHHRRYREWFTKEHAGGDAAPANAGGAKPPAPVARVRYEMPPPPVNPLLFRTTATRVAHRKASHQAAVARDRRAGR